MGVRALLDDAIEITVVGSFSRVGIALRRRLFGWTQPPPDALAGKTVLITGPTSGLGRAAAEGLAALGARVILVGRSPERLAAVREELAAAPGGRGARRRGRAAGGGVDRFPIVVADMGSLASVRAAVAQVLESEPRLDVVVDNAGTIYPERIEGPDGIEATLAILVVAPFVLVSGLLPLLRRTSGSRVIAVTSGGMYTQRLNLDDMQWNSEPFTGARAYARAKRAQTALIREWARRLPGEGVTFNAMHPGWVDTPGLQRSLPTFYRFLWLFLRTPPQGADTAVWLAAAPGLNGETGRFWCDRRPRPVHKLRRTHPRPEDYRRLWDECLRLSGLSLPGPA